MGNPYKNLYAKMSGWKYSPNTRMFKVSFWAVKTDLCDTRIIHFYYKLEHGRRKKMFTYKMRNLKKTGLQRRKNRGKRIRREKIEQEGEPKNYGWPWRRKKKEKDWRMMQLPNGSGWPWRWMTKEEQDWRMMQLPNGSGWPWRQRKKEEQKKEWN